MKPSVFLFCFVVVVVFFFVLFCFVLLLLFAKTGSFTFSEALNFSAKWNFPVRGYKSMKIRQSTARRKKVPGNNDPLGITPWVLPWDIVSKCSPYG